MSADQELLAVFRAEVEDQIDELCQHLATDPQGWKLDKLFHLSHNIKGAARLVGVDGVRDASHAVEDLFSAIRDGLELSPAAVALARQGSDLLDACFVAMDSNDTPEVAGYRRRIHELIEMATLHQSGQPRSPEVQSAACVSPAGEAEIDLSADEDLRAIFVSEVSGLIGDLVRLLAKPPSRWKGNKLLVLSSNVKNAARLVGAAPMRDTAQALERLFDAADQRREFTAEMVALARRGGRLLEASLTKLNDDEVLGLDGFLGEISAQVRETPVEDELPGRARPTGETLRVGVGRLDALMGLTSEVVGEVFRAEERSEMAARLAAMVSRLLTSRPELKADQAITEIARLGRELRQFSKNGSVRMTQLSERLQDSVRKLRMVRIDSLVGPFNRAVREAVKISGHRAELRVEGGETEVDRAVLDRLRDPLIHLIRNAIGHGIEAPEERLAAAKSEIGLVRLQARSAGAWVEISVSDDGAGIDRAEVRRWAAKTGSATPEEISEFDDEEVLGILLRPGFTTVGSVTELAGRGVGLDVVCTNVAESGGEVLISSTLGQGSLFVLRVPLTRLTTRGIVVRLGEQYFAAPIADVERTLLVSTSEIATVDGVDVVSVDGNLTPVACLGALLGEPNNGAEIMPAIVLCDGQRRRALLLDEVLGEREFIVQPLSWNLEGTAGLAGSTVMDHGRVVLVLDSRQLVSATSSDSGATPAVFDHSSMRRYQVLVVDDSVTSRTLEKNILSTAGYDVLAAVNGVEAL
ncbi:MAG: hybrid sensor histidine kinase/response regulator, partial [Thermoanaerobaculales bacterium]